MPEKQLPLQFVEQIKALYPEDWASFLEALDAVPVTSIRLKKGVETENVDVVPWCENGRYLSCRPQFTLDPFFHAGRYYVQEASSMFLYQALRQYVSPDSLVLDMCAAPGGKSTLISDFLSDKGFLVSNEYVPQRANILSENILKWGNPNCAVTNATSQQYARLKGAFDAVVVDAPCSGEGMFRKDDVAVSEWSTENVRNCVQRQREILSNAWQCLKGGGILIYSTCTFNDSENEGNIKWLLEEQSAEYLPLCPDAGWGVTVTDYGCRFLPHKARGEGFFISVVRKNGPASAFNAKMPKQQPLSCKQALGYILSPDKYNTIVLNGNVFAVDRPYYPFVANMLAMSFNFLTVGIPVASLITGKTQTVVPHPALPLSCVMDRNAIKCVDVDYKTAIAFLRHEALFLDNVERGFACVCFNGAPLGLVKNVGNRCNNLYPEHWRIRMNVTETEYVGVL